MPKGRGYGGRSYGNNNLNKKSNQQSKG